MERIFVFLRSPSAATSVLLGATVLALILANSPSSEQYFQIVNHHIGNLTILEWVNDALMAIFFLFVGLEVKREFVAGELNTNAKRVMPGIAALFGVLTPAFIYYLIAGFDPEYIHGWAIPTATDIAFSIGIISALGSRVPNSMKVFLTALAVIDDLIAIIVYYFALIVLKNTKIFYFFLKVSSVTQFSFTICLLRPTAKALSGTSLVIVEPAPTQL